MGAGGQAELDLERFLPYRLSVLSNTVSAKIAAHYEKRFGLSIPQWRVIAVLGRFPGLSQNDVAERTAMDKVQVSRAVTALVRAGRVRRVRDESDGRVARLELATAGHTIFNEVVPFARALEDRLLAGLGGNELAALDAMLKRLSQAAAAL
ncbi:MAG TPA: MarR family winged helix-turn-helix transcriptional regulator [Micropepsaceae bacterium]|nr:MarR family winged helix-turn-helix transcriptional regulator [Micropepsaceae bacterium]